MFRKSCLTIAFILLAVFSGHAGIPKLINYQGMLSDAEGNPLNATLSVQFSFFLTETEGTAFWSETHEVRIIDGLFNVLLGSQTSFDEMTVPSPEEIYLEIQVGDDPPMTPRKPLTSVSYAFRSDNADHLEGYSASSFVRKINNVNPGGGNIDLIAGSNVTISPDPGSHRITISASGGSSGGDDLGDHRADQNIILGSHWLSGDGGNEGISIGSSGSVSIPNSITCHSTIFSTGNIQSNGVLIGVSGVQANGGSIRTGSPSEPYGSGDIAATDDLSADDDVFAGDRVVSKGNIISGDNMAIENHLGVNMGGGYSTTYALQVNGISYFTGNITTGDKLMSSGHAGINSGGYSTTYALHVNGSAYTTGSWVGSDIKLKKNIGIINNPLSKAMQLKGISYDWKTDEYQDREFSDDRQYGFIAQEVEKIFPDMVKTDENGEKAVAYYQLIPVLLEALKQQQKAIEELQEKFNQLENR